MREAMVVWKIAAGEGASLLHIFLLVGSHAYTKAWLGWAGLFRVVILSQTCPNPLQLY